MKKKTSIVAGLFLLFLIIYSCEREEQINSDTTSDTVGTTLNKENDPLNILIESRKRHQMRIDQVNNYAESSFGCMDAYSFDKVNQGNSICFLEDFDRWGWSNYVDVSDHHYTLGGKTYTYPIYASAFQCDIENSMEVGEMQINISGKEGSLNANIRISLSTTELIIKKFALYSGNQAYPVNQHGQESINHEDFDISISNLNASTYAVNNISWNDAAYFITHIKLCPRQQELSFN